MTENMSCEEVRQAVCSYVACSLPIQHLARFYRHLVECEACRLHVASYRSVVAMLRKHRQQAKG